MDVADTAQKARRFEVCIVIGHGIDFKSRNLEPPIWVEVAESFAK
jgi:hypothetical protein